MARAVPAHGTQTQTSLASTLRLYFGRPRFLLHFLLQTVAFLSLPNIAGNGSDDEPPNAPPDTGAAGLQRPGTPDCGTASKSSTICKCLHVGHCNVARGTCVHHCTMQSAWKQWSHCNSRNKSSGAITVKQTAQVNSCSVVCLSTCSSL
eukprot:CAMPEP_0183580152 /NCGR_PEP_ID=MMETSP0371-20130417/145188_1 /TAXON_ID=268820 /ORGANISM="Peridinium aciculiferum, Strain PAER-2" /LENGTH=148 /DNA_ID=CAMNT_0025790707 /DNA_START=60 /DNA_END=504 /DNA_ORIENTATION=-